MKDGQALSDRLSRVQRVNHLRSKDKIDFRCLVLVGPRVQSAFLFWWL